MTARRLAWRVARHEWRALRADRAVLIGLSVLVAAVVFAGARGTERAQRWRETFVEYEALQARHLARFERRASAVMRVRTGESEGAVRIHPNELDWGPTKPDYPLAWMPPKAALPAPALAAAAVGDTETRPPAYSVSPWSREPGGPVEQPANPLEATVGQFDQALIAITLFPLFVITLCYDVLSAERDEGTLALVLAQPVAGTALLAGKYVARTSVAVLVPVLLVCAAILWDSVGRPGAMPRLALWAGAMSAYGLLWAGLAFWLNVRRGSTLTNAVALGAIWLLCAVLAPAVIDGALRTLYPMPSRAQWVDAERVVAQEARAEQVALTEREQRETLSKLLAENPGMPQDASLYRGDSLRRALALARTLESVRKLQGARAAFEEPRRAQERLLSTLRFLSPSILLQGVLYDLSGSGRERYDAFLHQTREFQRSVERWAWDRRLRHVELTRNDYAAIPRFRFVEETVGTAVGLVAVPMSALCALAGLATRSAFRRARRLPPLP